MQRLHIQPTIAFARVEAKNEPWPQSCWVMNTRTSQTPVGNASAVATKGETGKTTYIAAQAAAKGPKDVSS